MLRNTVNATIVRGGAKINVVPSEIEVELDGRALPGFGPDELIAEVQALVGDDVELELVRHDPGPAAPDLGLFDTLAGVIRELDPDGIPVPLLQIGVTDGRFFSRVGVQTYGFLPMRLPEDFRFDEADPRGGRADPGRRARVRGRGGLARDPEVPLRLLIIGGTKFLGRATAEAALARGHELTLFNRGADERRALPGGRAAARRPEARPLPARGSQLGRGDRPVRLHPGRRARVGGAAARRRPLRLHLERLRLRRLLDRPDRVEPDGRARRRCRPTSWRPTTRTTGR